MGEEEKVFYIQRDYSYNCFGADEHLRISLFKETRGGKMKHVNSWAYSTFLSNSLAEKRAARKIRELRTTYDAKFL